MGLGHSGSTAAAGNEWFIGGHQQSSSTNSVAVTTTTTNAGGGNTTGTTTTTTATTTAPIPIESLPPVSPPSCQVIDAQVAALQAVINNLKTQGCPVQSIPALQQTLPFPSSSSAT